MTGTSQTVLPCLQAE